MSFHLLKMPVVSGFATGGSFPHLNSGQLVPMAESRLTFNLSVLTQTLPVSLSKDIVGFLFVSVSAFQSRILQSDSII